jgi:hypothetical protein
MGVWLAFLDALPFDALSPFRELRLFVGQEGPFKPEYAIVEPRHSWFGFASRRTQDAAYVVKTGPIGQQ